MEKRWNQIEAVTELLNWCFDKHIKPSVHYLAKEAKFRELNMTGQKISQYIRVLVKLGFLIPINPGKQLVRYDMPKKIPLLNARAFSQIASPKEFYYYLRNYQENKVGIVVPDPQEDKLFFLIQHVIKEEDPIIRRALNDLPTNN